MRLFLISMVLLSGCATPMTDGSTLLRESGFRPYQPTRPPQQRLLEDLPQGVFVVHNRPGLPPYLFADSRGCGCIYAGGEADFLRFQQVNPGAARVVAAPKQLQRLNPQAWQAR